MDAAASGGRRRSAPGRRSSCQGCPAMCPVICQARHAGRAAGRPSSPPPCPCAQQGAWCGLACMHTLVEAQAEASRPAHLAPKAGRGSCCCCRACPAPASAPLQRQGVGQFGVGPGVDRAACIRGKLCAKLRGQRSPATSADGDGCQACTPAAMQLLRAIATPACDPPPPWQAHQSAGRSCGSCPA